MNLVIALCGMPGSGKSEVTKIFTDKGFQNIHLGVTEMAIEKFGETSEAIEKKLRVEIREEYGMAAMAIINREKIQSILKDGKDVIIDNMYSWSEYKTFLKDYGYAFVTVAIHASPRTRYERLKHRKDGRDYTDPEISKSRDYSEIEHIEKGGPIAMADFHIVNEGKSLDELKKETAEIFEKILKR